MQVKELKDAIADLPDDMEVILQKDAEGNGYSPLSEINSECVYIPDSTWSGDVYPLDWSDEPGWLDEIAKHPRALLLIPVN